MATYLLATASVHVTAAAADYLDGRLDPDDDLVVVGVRDGEGADRDVGDAANVARARLAAAAPEIDLRDGDPVTAITAAVDEHEPAVVVLGANDGAADASGLGSTAATLLSELSRPTVVVHPSA